MTCRFLVALLLLAGGFSPLKTSEIDISRLEQDLNGTYRGNTLIVRSFYRGKVLCYDGQGKLLKGGPEGPWTVSGMVEIKRVRIRQHILEIQADRILLYYDQERKKLRGLRGDSLVIEATLEQGPYSIESIRPILTKIFLSPSEQLADVVPDYWKQFCAEEADPTQRSRRVDDVAAEARAQFLDVKPPILLRKREPPYSEEARRARLQGALVLYVVVDARGDVSEVRVVRPLGLGLDEEAVRTIRKWKFKPATRSGAPIAARILVEISFRLGFP